MPTVTHTPFSFVRFAEDPYVLPAFGVFDVAFQFLVDGSYDGTSGLFLGVCTPAGTLIPSAFPTPVAAVELRSKLAMTSDYYSANDTVGLESITVGTVTMNYNELVTHEQFLRLMYEDFGYRSVSDNEFLDNGTGAAVLVSLYDADTIYRIDLKETWGQGYVKAPGTPISPSVAMGKCFRYCLLDSDGNILDVSNLFKVCSTENYTSLFTYSNDEDNYGFAYPMAGNRSNIIRLPAYISQPQLPTKKTVYVNSRGIRKTTSANISKTYQMETDQMPETFHECFEIMMEHDHIRIDCPNIKDTPIDVVDNDDYKADWSSGAAPDLAPGTSSVTAAAFGYTNSNYQ